LKPHSEDAFSVLGYSPISVFVAAWQASNDVNPPMIMVGSDAVPYGYANAVQVDGADGEQAINIGVSAPATIIRIIVKTTSNPVCKPSPRQAVIQSPSKDLKALLPPPLSGPQFTSEAVPCGMASIFAQTLLLGLDPVYRGAASVQIIFTL
jgi:hypothetical protein